MGGFDPGGRADDGSDGSDGGAIDEQNWVQAALPAYQVIMADELHDINEAAFRLLLALLARGSSFFCGAGDKDQVIYSWRAAAPQYLQHRFAAHFPALARYPLTTCYRHGAQLADKVAKFKQKPNRAAPGLATRVRIMYHAPGQDLARITGAIAGRSRSRHRSGQQCRIIAQPGPVGGTRSRTIADWACHTACKTCHRFCSARKF